MESSDPHCEARNSLSSSIDNGSVSLVINANKDKRSRASRCFRNYWKELKARSLNIPTVLLLIYTSPIAICTVILFNIASGVIAPPDRPCTYYYPESNAAGYSVAIIIENALYFLIPFCGWLSDAKIGRGNAIYVSLWLGWIGALLQSISCCFQYSSCGRVALAGKYGISGIALLFMLVSMAFMYANVLAYGMDQLMNKSSVKIRAFIHWYVWILFVNGNISSYTSYLDVMNYHTGTLSVAVAAFVLFSVSLCLHFQFHHVFEYIPIPNVYTIVCQVLKFSVGAKHSLRQRSAFTYWGKEPSRIDLAKERYGGSFTHEDVETVKTFLRILAILAALSPFLIASNPFINGISSFVSQFSNGNDDLDGNASFVVWFIGDNIILLLVPLFELVILPLFPKLEYFLMNPLRGLGLGNISLVLSILSLFFIDLIPRLVNKQYHIPCFTVWQENDLTINLSYWILLLPSILAGISDALVFICIFEFLCSQAPFGMHGMLIGLFWFLRALSIDIGSGITVIFRYHTPESPWKMSCTSWFTIILGLVAIAGLIIYVLTARWYVNRIRNADLDLRTAIEEQFEQRLIREESFMKNNNHEQNKDEGYVVIHGDDKKI